MRDWSSDVCSSDLVRHGDVDAQRTGGTQPIHEISHTLRGNFPLLISGVDAQMVQARLLKDGRDGVADGVTDYA